MSKPTKINKSTKKPKSKDHLANESFYVRLKALLSVIFKKVHKTDKIKNCGKDDLELSANIYDIHGTLRDYVKSYFKFHTLLKVKLIEPFLLMIRLFFRDILVKKVPKKGQYLNLHLFDQSFEEALFTWNYFRSNIGVPEKDLKKRKMTKKLHKHYLHNGASCHLRTFKELYLTGCKMDSVYLEFHNILMFMIAKNMNEAHGKDPKHLLYTSTHINDVKYYICSGNIPSLNVNISEFILGNLMKFIHTNEIQLPDWKNKYNPKKPKKTDLNTLEPKNVKKDGIKKDNSKS